MAMGSKDSISIGLIGNDLWKYNVAPGGQKSGEMTRIPLRFIVASVQNPSRWELMP